MALFPHELAAIFSYGFMQKAFLAGSCMAIIAPILGVFLVLRRQSLMADTLSHVSLAGVALGFYFQINQTMTTLLVVIVAAFILEYLRRLYSSYAEIATAILMAGGLALALLIMNQTSGSTMASMQQFLFGSIVAISWGQVKALALLSILLVILFVLLKRPLYVLTFDEATAHVDGLPVRLMGLLFNAVTGVAIAIMIPIAGALLISAIMVLPAAVGLRLGKGFNAVMVISTIIGFIGLYSGLVTSYQLDAPPGATITIIFILLFLVLSSLKYLFSIYKKQGKNN